MLITKVVCALALSLGTKIFRAVAVAQLIPLPEIRGSNPVECKFCILVLSNLY